MANKKVFYISAVIVLLVLAGIYAYTQQIPNPGHGADTVWISIDGSEMTLQEAINNGLLIDLPKSSSPYVQPIPDPGHGADQIWISIDGDERTLQDTISTIGLCGSSSQAYIGSINPGQFASKILVSINSAEMTLQDAIDSGEFCIICTSHAYDSCYDNDVYWYDSCDNREEKKEECGTSEYTGSNYCYDNDVYRDYVTRGCSGSSCTSSTDRIKQEECGAYGLCSGRSCITWTGPTENSQCFSDTFIGGFMSSTTPITNCPRQCTEKYGASAHCAYHSINTYGPEYCYCYSASDTSYYNCLDDSSCLFRRSWTR